MLLSMIYEEVLTFESVDEVLNCNHSNPGNTGFPLILLIFSFRKTFISKTSQVLASLGVLLEGPMLKTYQGLCQANLLNKRGGFLFRIAYE